LRKLYNRFITVNLSESSSVKAMWRIFVGVFEAVSSFECPLLSD